MEKFFNCFNNKYFQWTLLIVIIIYQLVRLTVFINIYGGIEHDSGWSLGVSRSLAEKGTYTTMVSSIANPAIAAGPNIHNQFEVQAEDGGIYFYVEGSVGPARVIPDAIIIKLFGSGFWQFRTASLLFYLLFLALASWLLLRAGSVIAVLLFHAFLFFYPHLVVFLGYEALGEMPALAYTLLAFALYLKAIKTSRHRWFWFLASGLVSGLVVTSKLLALLMLTGIGVLWAVLFFKKRTTFKDLTVLTLGGIFFPAAWELTQFLVLTYRFGFNVYLQHAQQRLNIFLTNGSGLVEQASYNTQFLLYKLLLITEIAHPYPLFSLLTLIIITASGPFLIRLFKKDDFKQNLVILLWTGWLAQTAWFILASENGWVRHYWFSLMLSVLLLALLWSNLLTQFNTPPVGFYRLTTIALTGLIFLNFYSQPEAATLFLSDKLIEKWYQQNLVSPYTRIPASLVSRQQQQQVADFIANLPPSTRIFYPEKHKSAEMAVLSGHIFYPQERRRLMPPSPNDIILIGPSLISPWRQPGEAALTRVKQQEFIQAVMNQIRRECPKIILQNEYYIVCAVSQTP